MEFLVISLSPWCPGVFELKYLFDPVAFLWRPGYPGSKPGPMHRGAMNRVRSEEAALSRSPECRGKPGPNSMRGDRPLALLALRPPSGSPTLVPGKAWSQRQLSSLPPPIPGPPTRVARSASPSGSPTLLPGKAWSQRQLCSLHLFSRTTGPRSDWSFVFPCPHAGGEIGGKMLGPCPTGLTSMECP